MRTILIPTLALVALASAAMAEEPMRLTDTQMDAITAGATLTFYRDVNFGGPSIGFYTGGDVMSINDLTKYSLYGQGGLFNDTWNDQVSSIKFEGSGATFYEHVNFQGREWILSTGEYRSLDNVFPRPIPNDVISSFKFQ